MTEVAEAFRTTMRAVATPVCVVTALVGDRPHGTTVSAFASLSIGPPMVTVALDAGSDLLGHLRDHRHDDLNDPEHDHERGPRRFGVNVLVAEQWPLALGFARKGHDKFDGVAWRPLDGAPCLDGLGGWLACDLVELVGGGDHVVVLGEVVAARPSAAAPLTYHDRRFGTHLAHDEPLHTARV